MIVWSARCNTDAASDSFMEFSVDFGEESSISFFSFYMFDPFCVRLNCVCLQNTEVVQFIELVDYEPLHFSAGKLH